MTHRTLASVCLASLAILVSACGSYVVGPDASPIPRQSLTPPYLSVNPETGRHVQALMHTFDIAVLAGSINGARSYLTPALQSQVSNSDLPILLGLPQIPLAATYRIVSVSPGSVLVNVEYSLPHQVEQDQLTLIPGKQWRVGGIKQRG